MKQILSLFMLLAATFPSIATDNIFVRLRTADVKFQIPEVKEITISNENVTIHLLNGDLSAFPLSDFVSLRFDGNESANITSAPTSNGISTSNNLIKSASNGIEIYTFDGTLKMSSQSNILSIESLNKGIYLVKTANQTFKIIKK